MSTIVVPGANSHFLGARAELVDTTKDLAHDAWVNEHVQANSQLKWIAGRFVEADKPNSNGQMWSYEDLVMAEPTIKFAPMNVLHRQADIVGSFVATRMMNKDKKKKGKDYKAEADGLPENPYIEALGAFWHAYFPDTFKVVERAHAEGSLFFSMECMGDSVTFHDPNGVHESETFDYAGAKSEKYGKWNDIAGAIKQINDPHFLAGALILPPSSPGWSGANVTDIARFVTENEDVAESVYNNVLTAAPHLSDKEAEGIMLSFMSKSMEANEITENNSIAPGDATKEELTDQGGLSASNSERGGNTVEDTTYTEADVQQKIADAVAPIQAELDALKAAADADEVQAKIDEIKAAADAEIAELQLKLDTAVLDAQAATEKHDALVAWLEKEAADAAEAAEIAERTEARLAQVQDVASFPAEYLEENAERWASMDEEAFVAVLADYAAASSTKEVEVETEETVEDGEAALADTAMKASREDDKSMSAGAMMTALRHVDFSTL